MVRGPAAKAGRHGRANTQPNTGRSNAGPAGGLARKRKTAHKATAMLSNAEEQAGTDQSQVGRQQQGKKDGHGKGAKIVEGQDLGDQILKASSPLENASRPEESPAHQTPTAKTRR